MTLGKAEEEQKEFKLELSERQGKVKNQMTKKVQ